MSPLVSQLSASLSLSRDIAQMKRSAGSRGDQGSAGSRGDQGDGDGEDFKVVPVESTSEYEIWWSVWLSW